MEHGPLKDPTFTNAMEVIIKNNTYVTLANKLGNLDKEVDFIKYYTYDCALSYLTWKEIRDEPDMLQPKENLRRRIIENLNQLKSRRNS